jgi:hypothetical protein
MVIKIITNKYILNKKFMSVTGGGVGQWSPTLNNLTHLTYLENKCQWTFASFYYDSQTDGQM